MAGPEAMKLWEQTFKMFDRDGGGDVDLRELGLMFRQLGQTPTERQMLLLIEEVDADGSGTVDFEEFCCLMLRQQRALRVPAWLDALLPAEPNEHEKPRLPTHALLSDPKFEAARRIQVRIDRAEDGNFGDCKPVGEGVSEMRIHFGPGYRIYFVLRGAEVVILLAGGDKSNQQKDIKTAVALARQLEG
jgi:putative addiction module killer protein